MTMANQQIREPRANEAAAISEMIHSSIDFFHGPNYSDKGIAIWKMAYTPQKLLAKIKERDTLVLEIQGQIEGIIQFDAPEIKTVYLGPNQMGKGLGRLLVEEMTKKLSKKGVKEVMLFCTKYVAEFYIALGFINEGAVITYWEGQPYDEFEMSKQLT